MKRPTGSRILKMLRYPAPVTGQAPVRPARKPSTLLLNGPVLQSRLEQDARALTGADAVFRTIDEIACRIGPDGIRMYETVTGKDLADFDLVQVLAHPRPTGALLSTLADHLNHHGRPLTNMTGIGAPTRILQMMRLARAGVPVPATFYLPPGRMLEGHDVLATTLGAPYVLTTLVAFRADQEWLIDGPAALSGALGETGSGVMAQQFIPNQGIYRMLVMGDRVALASGPRELGDRDAHEISRDPDQLLDLHTLDPAAQHLAVRAAQAMGYDLCAVLMIRHMLEGTWYVLEAHFSPPLGTGPYPDLEIEAYTTHLERRLEAARMGIRVPEQHAPPPNN